MEERQKDEAVAAQAKAKARERLVREEALAKLPVLRAAQAKAKARE